MIEYIEFIKTWLLCWLVPFVMVMSWFLTLIIVKLIECFTSDFMNSLVLLVRGWPPSHVQVQVEKELEEDDKSGDKPNTK